MPVEPGAPATMVKQSELKGVILRPKPWSDDATVGQIPNDGRCSRDQERVFVTGEAWPQATSTQRMSHCRASKRIMFVPVTETRFIDRLCRAPRSCGSSESAHLDGGVLAPKRLWKPIMTR